MGPTDTEPTLPKAVKVDVTPPVVRVYEVKLTLTLDQARELKYIVGNAPLTNNGRAIFEALNGVLFA